MTVFLAAVLIYSAGVCCGVAFWAYVSPRLRKYSGTIVVHQDKLREKIVYSLELDDYPEELRFKKVVIFKVEDEEDRG